MSPRVILTDQPGLPLLLTAYGVNGQIVAIDLTPLRALALARDLIAAAETRLKPTDAHHQPQEASQ